jgi:putative phosphonate catabolism associated alcohol dehydrogenase
MPSHEKTLARAQVFQGFGLPMVPARLPLPESLQPDEVLVEITLATICGSDLHTVDGRRQTPVPGILGHEAVGRVILSARPEIREGQRVTWSLTDSCGKCPACSQWRLPEKCNRLFKYGHAAATDGTGLNGCYCSHIVLRSGTTVIPLPDHLSDRLVAPANCALATIVNALTELPEPCERVLVQGAGLLGIYACAYLKSQGTHEVYCMDVAPVRLAMISEFGGIPVLDTDSLADIDMVIEVAGTSAVVGDGFRVLRPGGHYVWAGMVHPQTHLQLTGEAIVRKCLSIRGVHNYSPKHLIAAIDFLNRHHHRFPFDGLISPSMPLEEIDKAFELTRRRTWQRVALKP